MEKIILLSLIFLAGAFAQSGCGKRYLSGTRVVSGQNARAHSWPWQVSLTRGYHFCGGSLVNDQWVVTAAHCVSNGQAWGIKVRVGEHNFGVSEDHTVVIPAERVIVHPRYRKLNNDVALIKLSKRVTLKPQVSPVCLPSQGASVNELNGQECYITGWGRTAHNQPGARILQEARLPVISASKCRKHMGYVTNQMICAGFGGSSTVSGCMGDSGGPFVCRDKSTDRWYLHGAVSWGTRTCNAEENKFTVFARISEFADWIKQNVGGVEPPKPNPVSANCNFDIRNKCSYEDGRGSPAGFKWVVHQGTTHSRGTGPSGDTSGGGYYLYIESSRPRTKGDHAKIMTPKLSGTQCLKFSYNMYGGQIGQLNVYANTQKIFSKSGDQGQGWNDVNVKISINKDYQITFEGVVGSGYQGDIAIDDISVTPGSCGSGGTLPPPTSGLKPPSGKCGKKGPGLSDNPRIVGGQEATPGEWPWQVALLRSNFPFCGGSLVSSQYVITAAHCINANQWRTVKIRVGEHDMGRHEGHEQDISIAQNGVTVHPNYNSRRTDYDIAIIKLSRPIPQTNRVKPVCINQGIDFTGVRCYITGWGRLRSGGSTPKKLQEAQVPIVTREDCRKAYGSSITDRMICAGYPHGGTDTCQGDSGGPMVCEHKDGSWHLTGITSWGRGCASAGYYGVYAHVAQLYSWINQVTGL